MNRDSPQGSVIAMVTGIRPLHASGPPLMPEGEVSLDDKYVLEEGRVYLTGIQALVRLPLEQRRRDARAGLDTAGFISGYRGSPLGGYDQQLWRAAGHLESHRVHFQPGINEDLAATAIWGSQQAQLFDDAHHDGVFAYWYGKGPGVDRSGDVFRHGNLAGSAKQGGVLLIAGDDHGCRSSTLPHQSEQAFVAAGIPVLNPAGVAEILDFGIIGIEMSRHSGCWIGFKTTADNLDASSSIELVPDRPVVAPPCIDPVAGGLNIRWPDDPMRQEERLQNHKLDAARAFARANRLDRIVGGSHEARLGIVAAGKSWLDLAQALDDLGLDDAALEAVGLRLYKVGMTWPLETEGLAEFATGLEDILVIEEKRALIETQIKEALYHLPATRRPQVSGKRDAAGAPLVASDGELDPSTIARIIAPRLDALTGSTTFTGRFRSRHQPAPAMEAPPLERTPYFCAGCPHNTSTRVPRESRALAGIGCHYLALGMKRNTATFTHMGAEGASWIGQAPFVATDHVFVNLGDGTYSHSGLLAIRAAAAANVNITYKILCNDAVAMTGGQSADIDVSPPRIARQVASEGAREVRVVTDDPAKYPAATRWPEGCTVHHRDDLELVQRALAKVPGLTVLIYDQTCAAEKRRRRKRGTLPDPGERVLINEEVCEGCGDCGLQSNCVAIVPVETPSGRKRQIDQSSCNMDMSCIKGFCPALVTVTGVRPRRSGKEALHSLASGHLPQPAMAPLERPWDIVVAGIGGTGVVTVGALLGMAAHIAGKGVTVLDMIGMAQKGGAVVSHIRIARSPGELHAPRITDGGARLLLACDMVTAAAPDTLRKLAPGTTTAVVNAEKTMTGAFALDPDLEYPLGALEKALEDAVGSAAIHVVDATHLARNLLGDGIAANLFMLGYALQKGLLPLPDHAIDRAIELNGVAVRTNRQAVLLGRHAAHDMEAVRSLVPSADEPDTRDRQTLVERHAAFLASWQDRAWAARYLDLVHRISDAERRLTPGRDGLADAVSRQAFRLMSYKDEYEVARLYVDGTFKKRLQDTFEGKPGLQFHLAPPLISRRDPATGHRLKRTFGSWILVVFRCLAAMRRLRGTVLDPFGWQRDRRQERRLIADYFERMNEVASALTPANHAAAVDLANVPSGIRGFGHIKEAAIARARAQEAEALTAFRSAAPEDERQPQPVGSAG